MRSQQQFFPYCGAGPGPGDWLTRWNFDPVLLVLIACGLAAGLVLAPDRRAAHIAAASTVLVLFVSPLCALSSSLFAARTVHHIALALLLAPLLVRALALHRRAIPVSLMGLTAVQAAVFWMWHSPPLYAAALSSDGIFWAMQVSLVASAALWWARLPQSLAPAAVVAVLATMVQMGVLGALLTFAGRAFYAPHWLTTQAWGLSPLDDQRIAGLVMWAPASGAYLLIALAILSRSLQPTPAR